MIYTIYKITNKLNGKIYIGKHQTKDLNDGYMGSGKHLKYAINKYGIENFKKEYLFQFDNESDMNAKEAELVTEEFCLREDTYNLCVGGQGGFSYINNNSDLISKRDTYENKLLGRIAANKTIIEKYGSLDFISEKSREIARLKFKEKYHSDLEFQRHMKIISERGRIAASSPEANLKRITTMQNNKHGVGNRNSAFGTMWITNGQENKKIKKEVDTIPEGWYKGRKMK